MFSFFNLVWLKRKILLQKEKLMFLPDFCLEHVVAPRSCALFCPPGLLIPSRVPMKVLSSPAIQPESSTKYFNWAGSNTCFLPFKSAFLNDFPYWRKIYYYLEALGVYCRLDEKRKLYLIDRQACCVCNFLELKLSVCCWSFESHLEITKQ